MENNKVLKIDLDEVIRKRNPQLYKTVPRFFIASLEKLICQEKMNRLLQANGHLEGAQFCRGILDYLSITCTVNGLNNLPESNNAEDWRVIFISNHPLGGLDGMALIDLLASRSPAGEFRFIVNDLLMNIPPLRNVFLPVNTLSGKQSRSGARDIDSILKSDIPIGIFPAGLCSRLVDGKIQDLSWNPMFIKKAIQYRRDIIPIHFEGKNSGFFYKFAKIRKMLHIKPNLEMALLPKQVFGNTGSNFTITIGKRIPWTTFSGGTKAKEEAARMRELVYALRQ